MAGNLNAYKNLSLPQRMEFLSVEFFTKIHESTSQELNGFFINVISDVTENSYVRQLAIDRLMDLLFTNTIKARQVLTILLDHWSSDDVFLDSKRIKSLYYLYDYATDEIEAIFTQYVNHEQMEITAEASYHLGLINMQKGLISSNIVSSLIALKESRSRFLSANQMIENRIDANIFYKIVSLTIDILQGVRDSLTSQLIEIGNLLFEREAFSFNFKNGPFYIGFYRVLNSLLIISNESPKIWLNYRVELSALFYQYAIIQDQIIKDKLNLSKLSISFFEKLNTSFFEPFFALNFSAEKAKISARLSELDKTTPEASFLINLLTLSTDEVKKKADRQELKHQLSKLFPQINDNVVSDLLTQFDDLDDQMKIFKVFEVLSKPSAVQLDDVIIRSCLQLQSMRIYYGNYSEDDRNTAIANLIESAGYVVKDQTRRSISKTGKSAGEIDILISDTNRNPISIIEALNLTSVDKEYIKLHIDKIFTYDANGLENNYILVYANVANFDSFYKKYKAFVASHKFKYPLKNSYHVSNTPYAELKRFTLIHNRNSMDVKMQHIVINLFGK